MVGYLTMPPKHEEQCIGCYFDYGHPYASEGCLRCNRRFNQRNLKLPDCYKKREVNPNFSN